MTIVEPDDPIACKPFSPAAAYALTAPMRVYFSPRCFGLEHIRPERPCLYVGNHTIFGGIDWPLIVSEVYYRRGVLLRGLGDRMHFEVPIWRDLVPIRLGAVHGTRENCARLMEAGEHVLVYPGGTREICKRKGEQHRLVWKERTGFARMAIEHGYPILPFASVGVDAAFDILVDADEIMRSPAGRLLRASGIAARWLRDGDIIPPIVRGLGPTLLPRPERMYFAFGRPISTRRFAGRADDPKALWALRDRVAKAVEALIAEMLEYRAQDRDRGLLRRVLTRL